MITGMPRLVGPLGCRSCARSRLTSFRETASRLTFKPSTSRPLRNIGTRSPGNVGGCSGLAGLVVPMRPAGGQGCAVSAL